MYPVILQDRIAVQGNNTRTEERFGEIDYAETVIRIARYASIWQRWESLMHEALHGMDAETDTKLTEKQVSLLGSLLTSFLLDNGFLTVEPFDDVEEAERQDSIAKHLEREGKIYVRE